ncbi:hypothetical protein [Nocardioides seonyuensis]
MNRAAAMGRRQALSVRPDESVAVMVADLPQLRGADVDSVLSEHLDRETPLYVADHHDSGTTMLVHGPYELPGIAFGHRSAAMHERLGYERSDRAERGMRVDLDTPEDLEAVGPLVSVAAGGDE